MSTSTTAIPGYLTGTWTIDQTHSDIAFITRHLGISKVRGRFDAFEGTIVTAENPLESTVTATINSHSVNTNSQPRDNHVKSNEFLDIETFPTLTFASTGIRVEGEDYLLDGELTVHGVTKPVTLTVEFGGIGPGLTPDSTALGASASTEISRADFKVGPSIPTAVVSDRIKIEINIEAILQP